MDNVLFARSQMAVSLGFHIIFASVGITMPLLMVVAEWLWRKHGDPDYLALTRAWAKGTAVFFAVGAVSGTVLAFELGLLFPGFMKQAGAVIGLPFALEGFAFFTEAIFLGIYLYGWEKVSPRWHLFAGGVVAASGALSAIFVTVANAWMNAPLGFDSPLLAMTSPFVLHEVPHGLFAAYAATGIAVAAIHSFLLLKNPGSRFHRKALGIALGVSIPFCLMQPLIGHFAGHQVARYQPLKLAAMEGQFATEAHAPLHLGGIPDYETGTSRGYLELPGGLSFLATNRFDGTVKGLREFPKADWPSPIVHYAFQLMVALGLYLLFLSSWALLKWRTVFSSRRFLKAVVLAGPMGILALETGWIVTEVGRQPWVIYGVLRTSDAVTPVPGLAVPFFLFGAIYLGLGAIVLVILRYHIRKAAAA